MIAGFDGAGSIRVILQFPWYIVIAAKVTEMKLIPRAGIPRFRINNEKMINIAA